MKSIAAGVKLPDLDHCNSQILLQQGGTARSKVNRHLILPDQSDARDVLSFQNDPIKNAMSDMCTDQVSLEVTEVALRMIYAA